MDKSDETFWVIVLAALVWVLLLATATGRAILDFMLHFYENFG